MSFSHNSPSKTSFVLVVSQNVVARNEHTAFCRPSHVVRRPPLGWCRSRALNRFGARPPTHDGFLRRHSRSLAGRLWSHRGWRSLAARVTDCFDLIEPLLLFVDAHAEELDDRFSHPQPALQFVYETAAAFERQQDVHPIVESAHGIRQTPLAHFFNVLHGPA